MAITIKILGEIKNGVVIPPKQPQVAGRKRAPVNAPATRPVYVNDPRTQAAFTIAQKIEDLRQEIRWLEKQYRIVAGTHSDPSIDLRQLQFSFAERYVTVHAK